MIPAAACILCLAMGNPTPAPAREDPDAETSTPLPAESTEPDPWIGEDEPLLAGPRLADDSERTLVRFEFNGNLRRLDRTPEEAALDALNLDAAIRERVDVILAVRRTQLDEAVRANLDLFVWLQAARSAGLKPEAGAKVEILIESLDRVADGHRLRDDLGAVLPEDERRDFQRLIDEYWRALTLDELQLALGRKGKLTLAQARLRVVLGQAGNELRRAFERQCKAREGVLGKLEEDLLTLGPIDPKILTPVREVAERTKGKPSNRDCHDLTLRALPLLTPDQQRVWAGALLGISPLIDAAKP
ncbi:MAG: hypothetical protein U0570_04600 [Phycisphaerales bacterium]